MNGEKAERHPARKQGSEAFLKGKKRGAETKRLTNPEKTRDQPKKSQENPHHEGD